MNSRNISSVYWLFEEFKASFIKDLRTYVRYPAWLLGEFISTPLWFFFFALGVTLFAPATPSLPQEGGLSYFYFGFVFIILFSTAVWGIGQSVRNEQTAGTLEQFLLAPVSRITLIAGRWARVFLTNILIIGYTTLLLDLLGGSIITLLEPGKFLLSLGLYEIGLMGFGLLIAGLTMRIKAYTSMSNLIFFGFIILTGALFPINLIPIPIRYLSMVIPFTYFNDLLRHAALGTPMILPETVEYIFSSLLSISMLLVGFVAFGKIEEDARIHGSIATS